MERTNVLKDLNKYFIEYTIIRTTITVKICWEIRIRMNILGRTIIVKKLLIINP